MSKYKAWKSFEREIARKFTEMGFDTKRNWSSQFSKRDTVDLIATDGEIKLMIQCKYGKKPNLKQAWDEANQSIKKNEIPIGICRFLEERNTLIIMSWTNFEKLLSKS